MQAPGQNYLDTTRKLFRYYKQLGDEALAQVPPSAINTQLDPNSNSIAVIVKHISGNMLSRWTDFLQSDGEKTWRNRDGEFEDTLKSMEELLQVWETGWACLFEAIDPLKAEDVARITYIRNEGHTVLEAMQRQLGHYSYHIGQLVYLARHLAGSSWQSLSIPKGQSSQYNERKMAQNKKDQFFTDGLKS